MAGCITCGTSAEACNRGRALGWDGCCMKCDERGHAESHTAIRESDTVWVLMWYASGPKEVLLEVHEDWGAMWTRFDSLTKQGFAPWFKEKVLIRAVQQTRP